MPRYPHLQIRMRSHNPFALVSAVRLAMRRSKIDDAEIRRFTEEAFEAEEPRQMLRVCSAWAQIDLVEQHC